MARSKVLLNLVVAVLVASSLSGCSYNKFTSQEEAIKAQWGQAQNQLQRRNDLIPNLVETVKGYAAQEKEIFTSIAESRSKLAGATTPEQQIEAANQQSSALARLLVVVENYPQLKSDANFRDLQAQLEGTENRITVARNRYIQAVQDFNVTVRRFPTNLTAMVFGYKVKPNFTVENEAAIAKPPTVDFSAPAPAPQAAPEPAPAPAGN